ncbi:ATP-binding protein [Granulicella sp. S156]|uniref:ATP-binding protein n=1 Tax=Granulicella sp. S156 TaxID=1747224 RepID=UPI00131D96AF|nr:ATP-binding protein [Granulicella sp. S156]
MKSGSQTRLLAILLAVVTLAAIGLSVANLMQWRSYDPPTDGVHWTETDGGLRAYIVPTGTPGDRAGIRKGDMLVSIRGDDVPTNAPGTNLPLPRFGTSFRHGEDITATSGTDLPTPKLGSFRGGDVLPTEADVPTPRLAPYEREIEHIGVWRNATYSLLRKTSKDGRPVIQTIALTFTLEPTDQIDGYVLRFIALVYLAIGLYVLFRRWTAPKSTHFYVFCLVSFILYAFQYSGVFDGLDHVILWTKYLATALQPALFLHFAVSFTGEGSRRRKWRLFYALLYLPGAALLVLRYLSFYRWSATEQLQHRLDQIDYGYLAAYYIIAAFVFWIRYRREQQPLSRQQLKWLSRGTLMMVVPFTAFYVIPFLWNANVPSALAKVAMLSIILLPLTFSWAIVRYRLMDVDLIFKRGVTYTLATAALVGLYFGVVGITAKMASAMAADRIPQSLREWGLVAAIIIAALIFDPLKRAIQGHVDRIFDQKRLDYRETLVAFGRELNAQTDLGTLVGSIVERLPQTLLLTRVAVFLADDDLPGIRTNFKLIASHGLSTAIRGASGQFDLEFLDFDRRDADSHIFFESPQAVLRLPETQRQTAATLDLNYYVPCRAARHEGSGLSTIAVLGLGRTGEGDFLSSEDVELLESLAGYIGIAIQNAQLYRRLEQKIFDFERLRDFNENIVESINIGVFAVDLEDRIESWNAQMEVMYATPRADALRRPLNDVFPAEFLQEFDRLRAEQGVCTLYKFRLPTPTGESRTANITIAPLLNRDFHAVGRIIIIDDITDSINMEKQLTQSEKLSSIGLLAAGVAHEVNTPLAVISSYTQMLGKQLRGDEANHARLQPVLEKITQQTFRASEIVNGLLNFARMGTVDFARVDLNAMLRDTSLLLEHQLRSSRVVVEMNLDPQLPAISGNLGKLQQVAVNMIMNAKDALQDKGAGRIKISTARTSDGIEVLFEDDGPGMPPEVLRKIYDPFFTTKNNPKEGQRKGTGLGLAVTYGIVQEHGGTIEAVSTVGEGTVFKLLFPAIDNEGPRPNGTTAGLEGKIVHV